MSASFILIWDIYRISQILFYSFSIDYPPISTSQFQNLKKIDNIIIKAV